MLPAQAQSTGSLILNRFELADLADDSYPQYQLLEAS
jgi:hypothetical protein